MIKFICGFTFVPTQRCGCGCGCTVTSSPGTESRITVNVEFEARSVCDSVCDSGVTAACAATCVAYNHRCRVGVGPCVRIAGVVRRVLLPVLWARSSPLICGVMWWIFRGAQGHTSVVPLSLPPQPRIGNSCWRFFRKSSTFPSSSSTTIISGGNKTNIGSERILERNEYQNETNIGSERISDRNERNEYQNETNIGSE